MTSGAAPAGTLLAMTDPRLLWVPGVDEHRTRLARLSRRLRAAGLDAVVIAPGADLRFCLGRTQGSHERFTGLVVRAAGDPFLLVPRLESPGWAGSPAEQIVDVLTWADGEDPYLVIAGRLGAGARVGVDDYMPSMHVHGLGEALGSAVVPGGPVIRDLRMAKTADELEALHGVGEAIDRVHARVGEWLRPGRTEAQIGADIAAAIVEEGHCCADFVIVGSGPNGASPHHEQSDRIVRAGDPVVIDIGGPAPSGYFSDSTRTYVCGEPTDPEFERVWRIVRDAQRAGIAAARAGQPCSGVDAAARAVITDAGYGEYFITRTGHGIGMEVHEHPYMVRGYDTALAPGMAFSVEPGIYLPGRFGVRIEDIVAIGGDGGPVLCNHSPQDWRLPA
ncbi:Xaa-Pro dipeptidase [Propionibacterium australiense]|uniref:Peptidase M24 n=2 Tax=Propionibacterium australiense TaxID=119981 RepID=A0A383S3B0_9ACTN|nr:Peptidase M24 [Propionibacterium australiense]VEH90400.1 Xaa-Pro dipeptidase [Propionibacterium australiense]